MTGALFSNASLSGLKNAPVLDVKIFSLAPPQPQISSSALTLGNGDEMIALSTTLAKSSTTPPVGPPPMAPAGANTIPLASVLPVNAITANVLGFTPQHLPVLSLQWPGMAQAQTFILQFGAGNLAPGMQIQILPQTGASALPGTVPGALPTTPLSPGALLSPASAWPALDDVFQSLSHLSPQTAQAMARSLPNPAIPANFGGATLMFIAAARAADLGSWLSDKRIDLLQKSGREGLLTRMISEGATLARTAADTPGADWRSYPVPLLWQNEISKVMLHIKHDREHAESSNEKNGQTRFIMDLSLTRMGDVQLDGYLKDKRLDLVVRTQIPISASMQQAMRVAYATALEGSDMRGDIAFQGDMKNWMKIIKIDHTLGVSA